LSALDPTPAFDDENASLFAALGLVSAASTVLDIARRAARDPDDTPSDEDDAVMLAALGAIRLATKLLGTLQEWRVAPTGDPTGAVEVPAEPGALLR